MKEEIYIKQLDKENKEIFDEGIHNLETGNYDKAEEQFKEFMEVVDKFPPVYNKLAVKYIYCDELDEAQNWLKKALIIDEKFAPAVTNLGSIEKKKGNIDKARAYYEKAIKINEDYGPAYNNLGVIYREQGNFAKSVKNLKKARKLGSYAIKLESDKPFYKEKGCIIPLVLFILIGVLLYFWLI